MHLRPVRPLGTFHATVTKDGEAYARDGQTYILLNQLKTEAGDGEVVEIMFEDGIWMLARPADLRPLDR